jgi:hypothetical protein
MTTSHEVIQLPNAPPLVEGVPVQTYDLLTRRDETITFDGQVLATATSHRDEHTHPGIKFAPPKWQCSACRWFRPTLWLVSPDSVVTSKDKNGNVLRVRPMTDERRYIVQSSGMSAVPGEIERSAVQLLSSVFEVIRSLTITNRGPVFLPDASVAMLSKAADVDPHLDAVYDKLIDPLDRRRNDYDSAHTH